MGQWSKFRTGVDERMSNKQVVIDMSEKVKNGTGKDMEQWLLRIIVLWLISGGDITSIQGMI